MNRYSVRPALACRACGSESLEVVLPLAPMPPGDKYVEDIDDVAGLTLPSDIQMCKSCKHMQMSSFTDPNYIYETYLSRPATTNSNLKKSYEDYARQIAELTDCPVVLEVGSNDGLFLEILRHERIKAIGIEPAQNLVKHADDRGVSTVCDYVSARSVTKALQMLKESPNVILANHSFSNVEDIQEWASVLSSVLQPGGYLVIQTFYQVDVLRKNLIENYNHEHLSYCTLQSLSVFFARFGLRLKRAVHLDAKGGSIRCFFQKSSKDLNLDDATQQLLEKERDFYNQLTSHFEATRIYIAKKKQALQNIMANFGPENSLSAYGTSIGATVFSYQFGLAQKIEAFFDDDVVRQNRYSPGYGIPVLPGQSSEMLDYSHCIILAPLYADSIIRNNQEYLDSGGTFLKFWPEIEQVTETQ